MKVYEKIISPEIFKEEVSFFLRSWELNLGEARDYSREPQINKTLIPNIYKIFNNNKTFSKCPRENILKFSAKKVAMTSFQWI